MILLETTHWPLVVVGAVPDGGFGGEGIEAMNDRRLWSGGDVRLALVIRGDHRSAWMAQDEVFRWLSRHRRRLWRCVFRAAWIFEDEFMRRSAERWPALVGDRLFRGEVTTFCSVQSAVSWLATDEPGKSRSESERGSAVRVRVAERG